MVKLLVFLHLPHTLIHLQQGGGGAATKRGLDQHRGQQGLLPSPSGRMEGRRTHRQTAYSPRTFASQTQRAGLELHFVSVLCVHFTYLVTLLLFLFSHSYHAYNILSCEMTSLLN